MNASAPSCSSAQRSAHRRDVNRWIDGAIGNPGRDRGAATRRVGRRHARDHHDPHGARSRARLLRLARRQSNGSRDDDSAVVLHALDHAHLRTRLLPADGDGRLSGTSPALAGRAVEIPADAWTVAHRARARRRSVRDAVQLRLPRHHSHRSLGPGMVDGVPVGARVPADARRDGDRCGDDRDAQSARSDHGRLAGPARASLVRSACTGNAPVRSRACRVRGVSADSVDRRHGGRLWTGRHLCLERRAPPSLPAASRARPNAGVRDRPRDERVRRSGAMERAEISALYGAVLPQHHQVSALAAVSADDAGARAPSIALGRMQGPRCF